jgi:hypothetical protein
MMIGRQHPTARAELAIAVAVFLIGAGIGALVEAAELIAGARRAEREQLRAAGAVLDELEDERDALAACQERDHRTIMHQSRQLTELRRQIDAAPLTLPIELVREAIAAADDGELLRDAIAHARRMPTGPERACEAPCAGVDSEPHICDGLGHGCPHVEPDAGYEQDGAGGPGEGA